MENESVEIVEQRVFEPTIITDWEVRDRIRMASAMSAIRRCMVARQRKELVAPPRTYVHFKDGDLVFTVGGLSNEDANISGFRVYGTFPGKENGASQLVAVWDAQTGRLRGLVLGDRLGAVRTGAIGGVAIDAMARNDVAVCAVLGTGTQAETQLEAALVARPGLRRIVVYSREADNRKKFASLMEERTGRPIAIAESARQAVAEADVLIVATNSRSPVLDADWLKVGVHINSIGPKFKDAHELPTSLGTDNLIAATDSPEQLRAYPNPYFLEDSPTFAKMLDLSAIVAGSVLLERCETDTTLFCSVGLAGTEVVLADDLIRRLADARSAPPR